MTKELCECGHDVLVHYYKNGENYECLKCPCKKFRDERLFETQNHGQQDNNLIRKRLESAPKGEIREGSLHPVSADPLSDKIEEALTSDEDGNPPEIFECIDTKNIKEFIKRLKVIMEDCLVRNNIEEEEGYKCFNDINKLAGDKLAK